MTPLSVRMREAAEVLEEFSRYCDYPWPECISYTPQQLRREADHVEAEENE